ncbi:hypothetical protein GCM10010129_24790 [Streptomyces fumigatiscleroticus]|nr:hypothetical protein GCM10010129_24790 [Streptomyces fumigatiscleroticus]
MHAAGEAVDWSVAATEPGVVGFPSDYRQFVARFGAGTLEGSVYVSIPRPGQPREPFTVGRLPQDTSAMDSFSEWRDPAEASRYPLRDMPVWGRQAERTPCAG